MIKIASIRWDHVAAACVGVVIIGYAQWDDPRMANPGAAATVAIFSLFFGCLWECMVRLFRLLKALLTGQGAVQGGRSDRG